MKSGDGLRVGNVRPLREQLSTRPIIADIVIKGDNQREIQTSRRQALGKIQEMRNDRWLLSRTIDVDADEVILIFTR